MAMMEPEGLKTPTTLASWPLAVARALDADGRDGAALLAMAGLSQPALEVSPGGRVPTALMTRLWALVQQQTGDPAFGLKVAGHAQPLHFRDLGIMMLACQRPLDVLLALVRYYRLISDSVHVQLVSQPGRLGLCIRELPQVPVHPMALDAFTAGQLRMMKLVGGDTLRAVAVSLSRPAPIQPAPWRKAFGVLPAFGAPETVLWYPRDLLEVPRLGGNEALVRQGESGVQAYLAGLDGAPGQDPVAQARQVLRAGLPAIGTLDELARAMGLGTRSLRRLLDQAGPGFRALKDEVLMEQACQWLHDTRLPVGEVAARLGFNDAGSFSKAFRRHTGTTPLRWRRLHPVG